MNKKNSATEKISPSWSGSGDDLFDTNWVKKLKSTTDKRVLFTGFLYGKDVDELIQHCYLYVQPSDVEGFSPVILRAMGHGKCVLSSDIPENKFIVENNGFLFKHSDVNSLKEKLEFLISNNNVVKGAGKKSQEFVVENYSWDYITKKYEQVFYEY